jgi:hypothetical protein
MPMPGGRDPNGGRLSPSRPRLPVPLPICMFSEAKFYRDRCKLPVVRNAHGVIHDINENFVHADGSRPR